MLHAHLVPGIFEHDRLPASPSQACPGGHGRAPRWLWLWAWAGSVHCLLYSGGCGLCWHTHVLNTGTWEDIEDVRSVVSGGGCQYKAVWTCWPCMLLYSAAPTPSTSLHHVSGSLTAVPQAAADECGLRSLGSEAACPLPVALCLAIHHISRWTCPRQSGCLSGCAWHLPAELPVALQHLLLYVWPAPASARSTSSTQLSTPCLPTPPDNMAIKSGLAVSQASRRQACGRLLPAWVETSCGVQDGKHNCGTCLLMHAGRVMGCPPPSPATFASGWWQGRLAPSPTWASPCVRWVTSKSALLVCPRARPVLMRATIRPLGWNGLALW